VQAGREAESHARDERIPESDAGQIEIAVCAQEFAHFDL